MTIPSSLHSRSIATSVTTVHHLLSHSVSGLLAIQTFQSPLAVDYLSSLIDQTLLAPDFPFKLGPRIFAFLREVFHYHDFSVANFIAGLEVNLGPLDDIIILAINSQ